MYGKIRSCLKGVYVRKKLLNLYTGYLFCFMCYTHWVLLESCDALAFVIFFLLVLY